MKRPTASSLLVVFALAVAVVPAFAQGPTQILPYLMNNKLVGFTLPQVGPIKWGVMVGIQDPRPEITVYDVHLRGTRADGTTVSRDQLVRVNKNIDNFTWCWFDDTGELVFGIINVESHAATGSGAGVSFP